MYVWGWGGRALAGVLSLNSFFPNKPLSPPLRCLLPLTWPSLPPVFIFCPTTLTSSTIHCETVLFCRIFKWSVLIISAVSSMITDIIKISASNWELARKNPFKVLRFYCQNIIHNVLVVICISPVICGFVSFFISNLM